MSWYADRADIIDLTHRYCWALDENDWDALDAVFLPDATALLGTRRANNRQEIKATCSAALSPLDASQHIAATHQITVDGDRATCRCYLHAQHIRNGAAAGPNYIVGGRYDDELVRTSDGWRIRHRTLTVMWTEGNVGVIRGDGDRA